MTLSKLAQLANVSVSVVSKAFSGRSDISDAMREHVFSVARQHGCFQQFYHARYDKPVIAVIIPEVISKYYVGYVEILKKEIEANGYTMLLSINNFDEQLTAELIRYYTAHGKVDGLILVDSYASVSTDVSTAVVAISSSEIAKFRISVFHTMQNALRESVECLYSLGHRRIAYVGEALTESKGDLLSDELCRVGITDSRELIYSSRLRFEEAGEDGVEHLFKDENKSPTAIFGAYGYITEGIIAALLSRGYSIPEDVSVISMDNVPWPMHSSLDVAHIEYDMERASAAAIALLKLQMENPSKPLAKSVELHASFSRGNSISFAD